MSGSCLFVDTRLSTTNEGFKITQLPAAAAGAILPIAMGLLVKAVDEASLQATEPRSQQFLAAAADTVSTVLDGHCLVLGFRASIQVGSIFPFYMNLVTHRPAGLCDQ